MKPVGSALVSRSDANRTQPSDCVSSSSPSGRQIQRSLPRSSVCVGALDGHVDGAVLEHDEIARCAAGTRRCRTCSRCWLPVDEALDDRESCPVGGAGTAVLGGSSARHMISLSTAPFSTRLPPPWLMRPVFAQHARNTPLRGGDRIDVHVLRPVVAGELLGRLRGAQDDVAVRRPRRRRRQVDEHPRAFAGFRALSPVRRTGRGHAQAENGSRDERRHAGHGDRPGALIRDGRHELVDARRRRCRPPARARRRRSCVPSALMAKLSNDRLPTALRFTR